MHFEVFLNTDIHNLLTSALPNAYPKRCFDRNLTRKIFDIPERTFLKMLIIKKNVINKRSLKITQHATS